MVKDINGIEIEHGQTIEITEGVRKGAEYVLEHCYEPDDDPDLHIDLWDLVEYADDGDRMKVLNAEAFDGKMKKIPPFIQLSNYENSLAYYNSINYPKYLTNLNKWLIEFLNKNPLKTT